MKLTHRILLIGCAATGLAALFFASVATGMLPDAPYSRWVAVWTGALAASEVKHSVWGSLIAWAGIGREVWISVFSGALCVGIVTFQSMMLRLAFFFLDDTENEKQFDHRVYLTGIVTFLIMMFAWPISANATRISFLAFDYVFVLVILTCLPVFRYDRRYSLVALLLIAVSATVLGIERPSPLTLLPMFAITVFAIFVSTWVSWAYIQFVALEHIEEEETYRFSVYVRSFFRKPYAYLACFVAFLAIFACAADCIWRLARADGFLAERLAGYVLEDAKDARWLVSDPFLGDALARRMAVEGIKTPRLVHTGCNYDAVYQTNLVAETEKLGYSAKDLLNLKVAASPTLAAPARSPDMKAVLMAPHVSPAMSRIEVNAPVTSSASSLASALQAPHAPVSSQTTAITAANAAPIRKATASVWAGTGASKAMLKSSFQPTTVPSVPRKAM